MTPFNSIYAMWLTNNNFVDWRRNQYGESLVRTPSYEPCPSQCIKDSLKELRAAMARPDFIPPPLREILPPTDDVAKSPMSDDEYSSTNLPRAPFPLLNARFLNCGPKDTRWDTLSFVIVTGCVSGVVF